MKEQSPHRLAYGTDAHQFGDLFVPEGPGLHAVVILIHGGFWRARYDLTLMTGLAEDLVKRGIAAWNIEYRRVGDPGGGWPGTLLDVAIASDYLQPLAIPYALDTEHVIAVGHSAGGHLAFWLAGRQRLAHDSPLASDATPQPLIGAISLAGVVDLEHAWRLELGNSAVTEFLGGSPSDVPERYAEASPAALLPLGIRQVLISGTEDDSVPPIIGQEYTRKATRAGDKVGLLELAHVEHFDVINPTSAAWMTVVEEIHTLLALR